MQETEFQFAGAQGTELPARLWLPDGQPRLVLQISHGMTEYSGRYDTLAAALAEHGIACAAFDLRGHGRNPGSRTCADMGPDGWEQSLSDLQRFCERLRENFPGVPLGMLGFSLGSFLLRDALCRGMAAPAGVILAGTGTQPGAVLAVIQAIVRGQLRRAKPGGTTPLVQKLSFGAYNRKFAPNRTRADWLCADEGPLLRRPAVPAGYLSGAVSGAAERHAPHRRKARACGLEPLPDPAAVRRGRSCRRDGKRRKAARRGDGTGGTPRADGPAAGRAA